MVPPFHPTNWSNKVQITFWWKTRLDKSKKRNRAHFLKFCDNKFYCYLILSFKWIYFTLSICKVGGEYCFYPKRLCSILNFIFLLPPNLLYLLSFTVTSTPVNTEETMRSNICPTYWCCWYLPEYPNVDPNFNLSVCNFDVFVSA